MHRHKEPYVLYHNLLGFWPDDIHLYEQACLHRSSSICEQGRRINNERLEFLGDAILDAIVADILYHRFETRKEGFLTNTRSKIVKRESLNEIAVKIGLDHFITYSMRISSHNNYMYGNALEALIGAIYLDKGYAHCKRFVETRIINPFIDLEKISKEEFNFKSRLIEWGQKHRIDIEFALIETIVDQDNNPVFQSQALLGGISGGIGIGYSKKESQQNAARTAMNRIHNDKAYQQLVLATRKEEENTIVTEKSQATQ